MKDSLEDVKSVAALFEGFGQAVFVKDLAGRYLYINEPGAAMIEQTVSSVIGRTDFDLFAEESAEQMTRRDREIMFQHELLSYTSVATHQERTQTYESRKIARYDSSGSLIGLVGTSSLSGTKKSHPISSFEEKLSILRHDLKGPLTASQMKVQLARRRLKNLLHETNGAQIDLLLDKIYQDGDRLREMLDQIRTSYFESES